MCVPALAAFLFFILAMMSSMVSFSFLSAFGALLASVCAVRNGLAGFLVPDPDWEAAGEGLRYWESSSSGGERGKMIRKKV